MYMLHRGTLRSDCADTTKFSGMFPAVKPTQSDSTERAVHTLARCSLVRCCSHHSRDGTRLSQIFTLILAPRPTLQSDGAEQIPGHAAASQRGAARVPHRRDSGVLRAFDEAHGAPPQEPPVGCTSHQPGRNLAAQVLEYRRPWSSNLLLLFFVGGEKDRNRSAKSIIKLNPGCTMQQAYASNANFS